LVEDDIQARIRSLDKLAHRIGLRFGEVVSGVQEGDSLDAETGAVAVEKIG
jgi:hypothetical protein